MTQVETAAEVEKFDGGSEEDDTGSEWDEELRDAFADVAYAASTLEGRMRGPAGQQEEERHMP